MNQYRSIARINFTYTTNIIKTWYKYVGYIKPYYAIKSFQNQDFLKFLSKYDVGFDCASLEEINYVKDYNNSKIFANPTKSIRDILVAKNNNINDIVIDSIEEIQKIQSINFNPNYIIRITSDEIFSTIRFNKKFGAYPDEVENIINYISDNNLNLKGFSYHVGSKCSNMTSHVNSINIILNNYLPQCFYKNLTPNLIDIGGGFESDIQLLELNQKIQHLLPTLNNLNIKLIAEPGRLFSQGAVEVETEIIAIRERIIDNIKTLYLTINDSVYHSFQGKIFDGQSFNPLPCYQSDELIRCFIFGQTCDSLDLIVENCIMPYPKLGDKIIFKNMGAYSLASATGNFNGFSCCEIRN
ncbi:putative ornithine decarboxylase [Cafeteria roenbergensis virus]|uniref:Putative ornithine decarboxylase n=1 Tax=Cafeteria roenbergensis virus (strain BV-PW1) TaxID=693272 RepID=E3T4R7_CROVB|nr:putative ornithine decarboxylase [Cafeteria roenbergensis virus BV-PW1]ADO67180.1 putative ornithine decarboxylase [Cafeteria roenbergensis virus BV-PW1]